MTLDQIKTAVRDGKTVHWHNVFYSVQLYPLKDGSEQWLIGCEANQDYIGLTWQDGVTMNGKPSDFFLKTTN